MIKPFPTIILLGLHNFTLEKHFNKTIMMILLQKLKKNDVSLHLQNPFCEKEKYPSEILIARGQNQPFVNRESRILSGAPHGPLINNIIRGLEESLL